LMTKSNEVLQGQLREDSYISKHLIFLRINLPQRRSALSVILSTDSMSANNWRQLQIILRSFKFET
jgi:hypothetical protein